MTTQANTGRHRHRKICWCSLPANGRQAQTKTDRQTDTIKDIQTDSQTDRETILVNGIINRFIISCSPQPHSQKQYPLVRHYYSYVESSHWFCFSDFPGDKLPHRPLCFCTKLMVHGKVMMVSQIIPCWQNKCVGC